MPDLDTPNARELTEKIADIREWLVRIDTKVDFFNDVKHTADRAEQKADKALMLAEDNAEDITELKADVKSDIQRMQTTTKWAIGLTIPSILTVIGLIVTIAF